MSGAEMSGMVELIDLEHGGVLGWGRCDLGPVGAVVQRWVWVKEYDKMLQDRAAGAQPSPIRWRWHRAAAAAPLEDWRAQAAARVGCTFAICREVPHVASEFANVSRTPEQINFGLSTVRVGDVVVGHVYGEKLRESSSLEHWFLVNHEAAEAEHWEVGAPDIWDRGLSAFLQEMTTTYPGAHRRTMSCDWGASPPLGW